MATLYNNNQTVKQLIDCVSLCTCPSGKIDKFIHWLKEQEEYYKKNYCDPDSPKSVSDTYYNGTQLLNSRVSFYEIQIDTGRDRYSADVVFNFYGVRDILPDEKAKIDELETVRQKNIRERDLAEYKKLQTMFEK